MINLGDKFAPRRGFRRGKDGHQLRNEWGVHVCPFRFSFWTLSVLFSFCLFFNNFCRADVEHTRGVIDSVRDGVTLLTLEGYETRKHGDYLAVTNFSGDAITGKRALISGTRIGTYKYGGISMELWDGSKTNGAPPETPPWARPAPPVQQPRVNPENQFPDILEARKSLAVWTAKQNEVRKKISTIRMRQLEQQRVNLPSSATDTTEITRLRKEESDCAAQVAFYNQRITQLRLAHKLE